MIASSESVLAFWRGAGPDKWFEKDTAFDESIRARFLETYDAAAAGQLSGGAPFATKVRLLGELGPETARERAARRLEAFVA